MNQPFTKVLAPGFLTLVLLVSLALPTVAFACDTGGETAPTAKTKKR